MPSDVMPSLDIIIPLSDDLTLRISIPPASIISGTASVYSFTAAQSFRIDMPHVLSPGPCAVSSLPAGALFMIMFEGAFAF